LIFGWLHDGYYVWSSLPEHVTGHISFFLISYLFTHLFRIIVLLTWCIVAGMS